MQETIDALISALDAIARAHDSMCGCSDDCASVNIEDEDCDCGYVAAADDVAGFAREAIERARVASSTPKRALTFCTFAEKRPEHAAGILYLHTSEWYVTADPKFSTVEYSWFEYDDDGFTGCQYLYDPESPEAPNDHCRLEVLLSSDNGNGASRAQDHFLWCPESDFDSLTRRDA